MYFWVFSGETKEKVRSWMFLPLVMMWSHVSKEGLMPDILLSLKGRNMCFVLFRLVYSKETR